MQAPHSPQDLLPTRFLLGQEGFFVEDRSAQDATARAGAVQHHGALRRARDCGEQVTGEPSWGPHIISPPPRRGALESKKEDRAEQFAG